MRQYLPLLVAAIVAGAPISAASGSAPPKVPVQAWIVPVEIDKEAKIWYKRGNPRYDRDHGYVYPDRYYSNGSKSRNRSRVSGCLPRFPFDVWYGDFVDPYVERRRCR